MDCSEIGEMIYTETQLCNYNQTLMAHAPINFFCRWRCSNINNLTAASLNIFQKVAQMSIFVYFMFIFIAC